MRKQELTESMSQSRGKDFLTEHREYKSASEKAAAGLRMVLKGRRERQRKHAFISTSHRRFASMTADQIERYMMIQEKQEEGKLPPPQTSPRRETRRPPRPLSKDADCNMPRNLASKHGSNNNSGSNISDNDDDDDEFAERFLASGMRRVVPQF